jgi:hypothetical protein
LLPGTIDRVRLIGRWGAEDGRTGLDKVAVSFCLAELPAILEKNQFFIYLKNQN